MSFLFCKQKTAYEMRISDWSSDVCSSDLLLGSYETDRAARSRQAERELAEIEERIRFLNRVKAMPGAVADMLAEADKLSETITRLERQIRDEQMRLGKGERRSDV